MYSTLSHRSVQQATFLIIEDLTDQQVIIANVLSRTMPQVMPVWIDTDEQALRYLTHCREQNLPLPRLALLDLYLPQREQGYALLQQLKEEGFLAHMPLVVLSHSSQSDDVRACYDLGASSYITKPKTADEWTTCFETLRRYWFDFVTVPVRRTF